jgi:hypothetical protein
LLTNLKEDATNFTGTVVFKSAVAYFIYLMIHDLCLKKIYSI